MGNRNASSREALQRQLWRYGRELRETAKVAELQRHWRKQQEFEDMAELLEYIAVHPDSVIVTPRLPGF